MTLERVAKEFVCQHFGPGAHVAVVPLSGGLEARGIARAVAHRGEKAVGSFVVKPFTGTASRELEVHRLLQAMLHQCQLSPTLLGWRHTGQNRGYVFFEWVRAEAKWPWRKVDCSLLVMEQMATLHRHEMRLPIRAALAAWDYERELSESAHSTLDAYCSTFRTGMRPGKRPMIRAIERLVSALPRLRRELLGFIGTTLLHGDAHTGNVVLTRRAAKHKPVFIDWARARIGSPLEDVSSWVHSLSLWEPEARRSHDTMLQRYLVARGSAATVSRAFRDGCILAGACNGLAGALRYHLSVLADSGSSSRAQFDSYRAAADWLRIIRRADVCFGV